MRRLTPIAPLPWLTLGVGCTEPVAPPHATTPVGVVDEGPAPSLVQVPALDGPGPRVPAAPWSWAEVGPIAAWAEGRAPSVAAAPDGGFVLTWEAGSPCGASVLGLGADGAPSAAPEAVLAEPACDPRAAIDLAGRVLVTGDPDTRDAVSVWRRDPWSGVDRVFDVVIGPTAAGPNHPEVAVDGGDGFVVAWLDPAQSTLWARSYDDLGTVRTPPVPLAEEVSAASGTLLRPLADEWLVTAAAEGLPPVVHLRTLHAPTLAIAGDTVIPTDAGSVPSGLAVAGNGRGEVALAWVRRSPAGLSLEVTNVGADGDVASSVVLGADDVAAPELALAGDDALVVAWLGGGAVWVAALGLPAGEVLVAPRPVSDPGAETPTVAAVEGADGARVAVAWGAGGQVLGRVLTLRPPTAGPTLPR